LLGNDLSQFFLRSVLLSFAISVAISSVSAQSVRHSPPSTTTPSNTTEDLRGVSAVSSQIAWASATHGTFLRTTDGGHTWITAQVPDADKLDFRGVVAFSADEAFLMSAGPGELSRVYHTSDGGQHWDLQFKNVNAKGFFDSIAFWDSTHGVVLGDPVPDESGQLKFELLMTEDGKTWAPIAAAQLPPALEGEGAFAASNSCIALLPARPDLWFATGGKIARVFHSADRGKSWQVADTPIIHGAESAGIFSITFRDPLHGVIAGGDYKQPDRDGPNLAFTKDGGRSWTLSKIFPQSYFSAVAYDRKYESAKAESLDEDQAGQRLFIVAPKFVFDLRAPMNPRRISPAKKSGIQFNAVSSYPTGGAFLVGPHGAMAVIP
jgi:photosystem II stability/assembly factor-like uncharacterized protein